MYTFLTGLGSSDSRMTGLGPSYQTVSRRTGLGPSPPLAVGLGTAPQRATAKRSNYGKANEVKWKKIVFLPLLTRVLEAMATESNQWMLCGQALGVFYSRQRGGHVVILSGPNIAAATVNTKIGKAKWKILPNILNETILFCC